MFQGFCGICYQVCDVPTTVTIPFQLSGTSATAAAVSETSCLTDWIQIPCATDQQSSSALQSPTTATACVNKICGNVFTTGTGTSPTPVYSKCLIYKPSSGWSWTAFPSLRSCSFDMLNLKPFYSIQNLFQ